MLPLRSLTALVVFSVSPASAQVFTNSSLSGKYFARHLEFSTDANNNVTDARSIIGAMTFDGGGNYSFNGQQAVGTGAAASFTVTGTYSMNSAGMPSGSTSATIVVTNNGIASNSVTVPFSATSPGIFSDDLSGTGDGAIVHGLTGLLVTPAGPAVKGETLAMYLTGLGAVQNKVVDGAAPDPPTLDSAMAAVAVYVNGIAATVNYAGLNAVYPGLYQINFVVPVTLTVSGELAVTVETPDSFHDQINLSVQ